MHRRPMLRAGVMAIFAAGLAIALVGSVDTGPSTDERSPRDPQAAAPPGPTPVAPPPRPGRPGSPPPTFPTEAAMPPQDREDGGEMPWGQPADDDGDPSPPVQEDPTHEVSVWPLSKEGIQGAVDEALPALKDCYDEALSADPTLAGRMTLGFTVVDQDGLGKVTVVELDDGAVTDDGMIDCVLDAFEALQFDPPEGGSELSVRYPVAFDPEGPEDG